MYNTRIIYKQRKGKNKDKYNHVIWAFKESFPIKITIIRISQVRNFKQMLSQVKKIVLPLNC